MNAEYLLDAVGLLDDGLLREAEEYQPPRRDYRPWIGLAASFAIVLTLGYALTHLGMGGGAAPENQASGGAANAPAGSYGGDGAPPPASTEGPDGSSMQGGGDWPADSPGAGSSSDNAAPQEPGAVGGDYCAAIMVDGVVYWSTDTPVPGEVEESAVRTATSYTDGVPEEDGQTNFDRDLTAQYAMTDMGLVVLIDQEWILFDPVPPWEK